MSTTPQYPNASDPNNPDPNSQNPVGPPNQAGATAPLTAKPGPGEPFNGAESPDDLHRPLYGAGFGTAIKRFLKNYVNFKGRASRSEYWWSFLLLAILEAIGWIIVIIGSATSAAWVASHQQTSNITMDDGSNYTYGPGVIDAPTSWLIVVGVIFSFVVGLALLLPTWGILWRRLHDANLAGPLALLLLIPYVGWIPVLILTFMGSKPAGRRFDQG